MDNPSSCAEHPDRVAARTCPRCAKPFCDLCAVEVVAAEQAFCSERCRDAASRATPTTAVDNSRLEAFLDRPIRAGWALAARSAGRVLAQVLPIAVLAGVLVEVFPAGVAVLPMFILVAFSVTLIGVILSERHAGVVEGSPYLVAGRRFVSWLATWVLIIGIVLVGYVALILPGIYLALRLFWADEFALIHAKSPFAALRASWELARGQVGIVFLFQFLLGLAQYVILIPTVFVFAFAIAAVQAAGLGGNGEWLSGLETGFLFLIGSVAYAGMHGPEIVQLYGMRAVTANAKAGLPPVARRHRPVAVAAIAGVTMLVPFGIIAAIAIPNLLNAIDRGKGKRTYADSREIAVALETYAESNGEYPLADDIEDLVVKLVPEYAEHLTPVDGWRRPFRVVSTPGGYEIRSAGKDGIFETGPPRGATSSFDDDIVWRDAELVQWPDHLR